MPDMFSSNPYEQDLAKNPANYVPLSPVSLLAKTALAFPDYVAIRYGDLTRSWAQTHRRCAQLAAALHGLGLGKGDTVAMLAPNIPAAVEASLGVPLSGAVLNMLNIRLDAANIAYILDHSEAKLIFIDREFTPILQQALTQCHVQPVVIDIDDPDPKAQNQARIGKMEYEAFLASAGDVSLPSPSMGLPADEWDALTLNYTSGTTGNPKGVVYHHRGAFLSVMSNATAWEMPWHPVYLWTLPLFHCNGWCFPWTVTALAGTHVCLRRVEAGAIYQAIAEAGVTHLCGAPIVLNLLVNASEAERRPLPHSVAVMTAASAPPAAILERSEAIGFRVTHVYGLTEVYGPAVVCDWKRDWDHLSKPEQAALKARQGVRYSTLEGLMVADPKTLIPVQRDGISIGEVFMRGNLVMKGYLKDPDATRKAFSDGWFHTGDLGVWHSDGYIELKDRAKDIIISGGENISTIEIENLLYRHPDILEAAVVACPDEKWGERPCAFVTLHEGADCSEADIIEFCRTHLAGFKIPKTIIFSVLPKTSTGKIQKFVLRQQVSEIK